MVRYVRTVIDAITLRLGAGKIVDSYRIGGFVTLVRARRLLASCDCVLSLNSIYATRWPPISRRSFFTYRMFIRVVRDVTQRYAVASYDRVVWSSFPVVAGIIVLRRRFLFVGT